MIQIFDIAYEEIEVIKNLWEKNRKYHEDSSEYFKESYHSLRFDQRIKAFGTVNKEALKITVAKDNNEYIGYCISMIIDGNGEIVSLHVEETNRGYGIGKNLVRKQDNDPQDE